MNQADREHLFAPKTNAWDKIPPIPSPLPMTLEPGEGYFHYCSLTAALNILSPDKNYNDEKILRHKAPGIPMWASHFLFLNDKRELVDGLGKVCVHMKEKCEKSGLHSEAKECLEKYLDYFKGLKSDNIYEAPNNYIVCFCLDGNLLSQWTYYGKESGIAIELDLNSCQIEGLFPPEQLPDGTSHRNRERSIIITPQKVLYEEADKASCLETIMQQDISKTAEDAYAKATTMALQSLAAASLMKHDSWKGEKEVRLLFSPLRTSNHSIEEAMKRIHYREDKGQIKPYLPVRLKHKTEGEHIVKSITIGPGERQELIANGMLKLVQTRFIDKLTEIDQWTPATGKDYDFTKVGDIEVRRSTIPLRA